MQNSTSSPRQASKEILQRLAAELLEKPDSPSVINQILRKMSDDVRSQLPNKILPMSFVQEMFPAVSTLRADTSLEASSGVTLLSIDARKTLPLPMPKGLEERLPQAFSLSEVTRRTFVLSLENGSMWGDSFNSAILSGDGRLLKRVSSGNAEIAFCASQHRQPLTLEGSAAFLTYPGQGNWVANYYHWMLQTVPLLELITRDGRSLPDYFLVYQCQSKFQKESFRRLGIDLARVVELRENPFVTAKTLVVPSSLGGRPLHKWVPSFMQTTFVTSDEASLSPVRVYVSRKHSTTRRISNESAVVAALEKRGFSTVYLEQLTVSQQAALFSRAEIVVAPHGAGLTNLVFCRPQAKVIEFFPRSCVRNCYHILSVSCELDYYYLLAEDVSIETSTRPDMTDMRVSIGALNRLLDRALDSGNER